MALAVMLLATGCAESRTTNNVTVSVANPLGLFNVSEADIQRDLQGYLSHELRRHNRVDVITAPRVDTLVVRFTSDHLERLDSFFFGNGYSRTVEFTYSLGASTGTLTAEITRRKHGALSELFNASEADDVEVFGPSIDEVFQAVAAELYNAVY
jgi:hypothetical protein